MKVLIMSHNPITDYNSMGKTFFGLFSEFSQNELCQFYVYPTLPNVKVCESYFRITDKEALKSIFKRKNTGRIISEEEIKHENALYENSNSSKIYRDKNTNREIKIFVRDIIWKFSTWKSTSFKDWLSKEKPDVIFAAPGSSGFFYDLILSVAKGLNIPVVTYVCDDFYFSNKNKVGFVKKVYAKYIRKKITEIMKKSKEVVTISEELATDYAKEFGCKCTVVSTATNLKIKKEPHCVNGKNVSYFGNLQLGREISLLDIAKVIDRYNLKYSSDMVLNVYTADDSEKIKALFSGISCVKFHGFLSSNEMYKEMSKASILLHIESFENENRERVKYSISTKIADSLASGVFLFAYGPKGIASIEYLKRNNCAGVAVNKKQLQEKLFEYLNDFQIRNEIVGKALFTAKNNHDSRKQSELLKSILLKDNI